MESTEEEVARETTLQILIKIHHYIIYNLLNVEARKKEEIKTSLSQGVTPRSQGGDAYHQGPVVAFYLFSIKLIPNGNINVTHCFTEGEPDTKIYSIKFDWEDKYIAAACENGEVRVYNVKNRNSYLMQRSWHTL